MQTSRSPNLDSIQNNSSIEKVLNFREEAGSLVTDQSEDKENVPENSAGLRNEFDESIP